MSDSWPWLALILLGAYHGINPGMGWLFAVALGLQEQRRRAVLAALLPITVGHALSVAAVVLAVGLLDEYMNQRTLRMGAAVVLIAFGLYKLVRSSHPRWGGMQVGWRDLTIWSFLMASAHGAGLMLVPVILGWPEAHADDGQTRTAPMSAMETAHGDAPADDICAVQPSPLQHPPPEMTDTMHGESPSHGSEGHAGHLGTIEAASRGTLGLGLLAVVVHTLAYLLVTAGVAVLVYEKLGLALLRRAWWNLDLLWAFVLIATGLITLVV
jgi:hypothetical protein